jgi:hypothetical protein
MKKYDGKILPLYELARDEVVPEELLSDKGSALVMSSGKLWKLSNTPMHNILSPWTQDNQETFVNSEYGDPVYDTKFTYLINNRWADFKLSIEQFRYVMKYFREIYSRHKTEACVVLMLSVEKKQWEVLFVPQLSCSQAAVNYLLPARSVDDVAQNDPKIHLYKAVFEDDDFKKLMLSARDRYEQLLGDGYRVMGTIHSHSNFSAFHSGVDDNDEENFDGLHITIGNVNGDFSFSARYSLGRTYWTLSLEEYFGEAFKSITDDIDSIVLDEAHLALIRPELGRRTFTHVSCSKKKDYRQTTSFENKEENWSTENGEWWNPNEEIVPLEATGNVFTEDDLVRLFDIVEGESFVVTRNYYESNQDEFPEEKYQEIEFGEIDEDVWAKHTEHLQEQKATKAKQAEEVYFLNDPRLNDNFSKDDRELLVGNSQVLYNRLATKKVKK